MSEQPGQLFKVPKFKPHIRQIKSESQGSTQKFKFFYVNVVWLPWWLRWQRIHLQRRTPGFNPWVRKIPWRMAWQPTPVFQPGEFHGQRSLAGYSPWGCKESDTTEWLSTHKTVWDLWKIAKRVQSFLILCTLVFPIINLLHYYGTFVMIKKPILIHYY